MKGKYNVETCVPQWLCERAWLVNWWSMQGQCWVAVASSY